MRAKDSHCTNLPLTLARKLASARWVHIDGELVTASEVVNPTLRDEISERTDFACDTPHFSVFEIVGSTILLHRFGPDEIDNDLAEFVAGELVRPGLAQIPDAFERCFAGVVLSSSQTPEEAWKTFYENTLERLERAASGKSSGYGPIPDFAGIYSKALDLTLGSSLLDVGTCFGFFPLFARRLDPNLTVSAVDISAPIVDLARFAATLHPETRNVEFARADALDLPFPGDSFDTVASLHVLEHLPAEDSKRALSEMRRVARRRVVAAVPFEEEPDAAFDHLRTFDRDSFITLTESVGWRVSFEEYRGGWVVLDAPRSSRAERG